MLRILTTGLFLLIAFSGAAQTFPRSQEGLESFIRTFYEVHVNGLKKSGDVTTVQSSFDPAFSGNEIRVDLDGKVKTRELSPRFIVGQVEQYLAFDQLEIEYSVKQFYTVQVTGNYGVAEFELDFVLREAGAVISEGKSYMTQLLRHTGDTWKITYISDLEWGELRTRGECYCEVFSRGKNKYVATILYPDGEQYTETLYQVRIGQTFDWSTLTMPAEWTTAQRDRTRKFSLNDVSIPYYWDSKMGTIYEEETEIGTAKNPNQVIRGILLYRYSEHCRTLTLRKKR